MAVGEAAVRDGEDEQRGKRRVVRDESDEEEEEEDEMEDEGESGEDESGRKFCLSLSSSISLLRRPHFFSERELTFFSLPNLLSFINPQNPNHPSNLHRLHQHPRRERQRSSVHRFVQEEGSCEEG